MIPKPRSGNSSSRSDFFVGIDSDGCVFDTMEVKHKECFIPNMIRYYRTRGDFSVLPARRLSGSISTRSGGGRTGFRAWSLTMDFLGERPEVLRRRPRLPALTGLRAGSRRETRLGNPALKAEVNGDRRPGPGPGARVERGGQPFDRRDRQGRAAVSVRAGIAREHGGQGRRDGGLGHPGRGPRARVGRAWAAGARRA